MNIPIRSGRLPFQTQGYEDMELSTQALIKEALKRNIIVEVLDRRDNFISLEKDGTIEYVKQATRTSGDTYIAALIMENKQVTKTILNRAGLTVPSGKMFHAFDTALESFARLLEDRQSIVVKPNSTNFGKGISILGYPFSRIAFENALSEAFQYDCSVIVERYIPGKEYRFLVIGDRIIGILHRIPANVTGDGVNSIRQLVNLKNLDPIRGIGYTHPLEKIRLGKVEQQFLADQGFDPDSIPKRDERVFLRKNSNISTGGDSLDLTDDVLDAYRDLAVKSVKAVGASICGVDMIIDDIHRTPTRENHCILELNFNPAIHIHDYPYQGKNRHAESAILDLLGF